MTQIHLKLAIGLSIQSRYLGVFATFLMLAACSGSDSGSTASAGGSGAVASTGGSSASSTSPAGGQVGTGGSTNQATGGATTTGGSNSAVGGATAGGTQASGGAVSTGGVAQTGGKNSLGGNSSTGAASATGGTNAATGGANTATGGASTGGTKSTGGASSGTGGKTTAGGTASTGGSKSTGGTVSTGGSTSAGGVGGTGGSSSAWPQCFQNDTVPTTALLQRAPASDYTTQVAYGGIAMIIGPNRQSCLTDTVVNFDVQDLNQEIKDVVETVKFFGFLDWKRGYYLDWVILNSGIPNATLSGQGGHQGDRYGHMNFEFNGRLPVQLGHRRRFEPG